MTLVNYLTNKLFKQEVTFAEYMADALYHPDFGYYTTKKQIFGKTGDFITAPEISNTFAQAVAQNIIASKKNPWDNIIEFGAGTGKLAAEILLHLKEKNFLPDNYYIIEISNELKATQKDTIKKICPALIDKVKWLTQPPNNEIEVFVIANEVIDAMPVHRYLYDGKLKEYYVGSKDQQLYLYPKETETNSILNNIINKYLKDKKHYIFEVNYFINDWLKSIFDFMSQGHVLVIDYGYGANEFYQEDRQSGTITCHYRHTINYDPLINIGDQDITSKVNFTQIADIADNIGFDIRGYNYQNSFILNSVEADKLSIIDLSLIKTLIMPTEMGQIFKAMLLSKNIDGNLPGFKDNIFHKL